MWIFTVDGLFSVVKSDVCKAGEVAVRGRSRMDLERLKAALNLDATILSSGCADYEFCVRIPAKRLGAYLAAVAEGVDYDNFKDASAKADARRMAALIDCWQACYANWPR